jgi:hypothetical protein
VNLKKLRFAVSVTIINRAAEILQDIKGHVRAGVVFLSDVVQPLEDMVNSVKVAVALIKEINDLDAAEGKWHHAVIINPSAMSTAATNSATDPSASEPPTSSSSRITATMTYQDVEDILGEERNQRLTQAEMLGETNEVRTARAVWVQFGFPFHFVSVS